MGDFLNMSEEDIKLKFITPSIMDKGWGYDNISMEKMVKFTDGKINLRGNLFLVVKQNMPIICFTIIRLPLLLL